MTAAPSARILTRATVAVATLLLLLLPAFAAVAAAVSVGKQTLRQTDASVRWCLDEVENINIRFRFVAACG